MNNKAIIRIQPWHALTLLIVLNILLALLIGDQYGQTWDESSSYIYGERSFDAYMRGIASQPLIPEKHIFFILRYYGPIYTAIGWKVVETLKPVLIFSQARRRVLP